MAHSGGGGHHGGGHHSGGHHGGGSSRPSRSNRYFHGSYHHHYYNRHGRYVYYYSADARVAKPSLVGSIVLIAGVMFFLVIAIISGMQSAVHLPIKMHGTTPDRSYVIDQADFLSDAQEQELNQELQKYYDATGINPCVYLIDNKDWRDNFDDLQSYSLANYYRLFDDEKHYLVVYADTVLEDGWHDWYFETMVGDDTLRALGHAGEEYMSNSLYANLNRTDVNEAMIKSFEDLIKYSKRIHISLDVFGGIFAFGIIFIVVVVVLVVDYRNKKDEYEYSLRNPDTVKNPMYYNFTCPNCGYNHVEVKENCDRCGTPLKIHSSI